ENRPEIPAGSGEVGSQAEPGTRQAPAAAGEGTPATGEAKSHSRKNAASGAEAPATDAATAAKTPAADAANAAETVRGPRQEVRSSAAESFDHPRRERSWNGQKTGAGRGIGKTADVPPGIYLRITLVILRGH